MSTDLDNLRAALATEASSPFGAGGRVAAIRLKVLRRRRERVITLVAVAAALVAGGGWLADGGTARREVAPVAVTPSGLPEHAEGGRSIGGVALPARVGASASFRVTPASFALSVVHDCPQDGEVALDVRIGAEELTSGTCGGSARGPFEKDEVLWRRFGVQPGEPFTVTVRGTDIAGAPTATPDPSPTAVRVGIYQDVPVADYPMPPRPAEVTGWIAYAPGPDAVTVDAQGTTGTVTRTVPYRADLRMQMAAWAPGLLRVLIDGRLVSVAAWWYYSGRTSQIDLTPTALEEAGVPVPAVGDPVRISIAPERFTDPAWSASIGGA